MRETFCTDHWRARFAKADQSKVSHAQVLELIGQVNNLGFDTIQTANLYSFDGVRGYSLAQGE